MDYENVAIGQRIDEIIEDGWHEKVVCIESYAFRAIHDTFCVDNDD